jgi:carbohydrate-binding DOMON domain-containing protein
MSWLHLFNRGFGLSVTLLPTITPDNRELPIYVCMYVCTQYRLVQSGRTASGGCSAGQGSSEPVAPRIYLLSSLDGIYSELLIA